MTIRWRLREVMAHKKMTSRNLARHMRCHENTVYRLKKFDSIPALAEGTIEKLCSALKCEPADLFSVENS